MTVLTLPTHKKPALGQSMKLARAARIAHKDDPFAEPHNGIMRPAVFDSFAAVACFGDEQPPAGFVQLDCPWFAARVFVPARMVPAGRRARAGDWAQRANDQLRRRAVSRAAFQSANACKQNMPACEAGEETDKMNAVIVIGFVVLLAVVAFALRLISAMRMSDEQARREAGLKDSVGDGSLPRMREW